MDHGSEQDDQLLAGLDGMEQGRSSTANEMSSNPHGGASTPSAVSRGPRPLQGPLPGRSEDGPPQATTLQAFASEVQAVVDAAAHSEDADETPASSAERHR